MPAHKPKVFICALEASADFYGAALAKRLLQEGVDVVGSGGRHMRNSGMRLVANSSWGVLGANDALKRAPKLLPSAAKIASSILFTKPGLFIPIDGAGFNVPLCKLAKKCGWRVLYFIPPQSHQEHTEARDLPRITDAVVTPFARSADSLRSQSVNAYCWGHPLSELIYSGTSESTERSAIALLPGSRPSEIKTNLPILAELAKSINERFVISAAPTTSVAKIRKEWSRLTGAAGEITDVPVSQLLSKSSAAVVCSGTAVLEAALCDCPTVVFYRASEKLEAEARRRFGGARPAFIALPNIIMNRQIFPELLQGDATPIKIFSELKSIIHDEGGKRSKQMQDMAELRKSLGGTHALSKSCELVMSLLNKSEPPVSDY